MAIDFNELEQRVLQKLENNVALSSKDDVYAQLADFFRKEAVHISIIVLAEYEQMKRS